MQRGNQPRQSNLRPALDREELQTDNVPAMNDVDDSAAALRNLGLDQRDLTLVSGLTAAGSDVNIREFHTVAGLVDDQKKSLYSLGRASEVVAGQL